MRQIDIPNQPDASSPAFAGLDTYIESQLRRFSIPGAALAVVEGDQIVHQRGFGYARPGGETPSPETPFFIGSLTKSFTALAIMQLVEAGKVELDAPVQRYLPWFRLADAQASAQISVRHLLHQTSGLPVLPGMSDLGELDPHPGATERQVRALSTLKLARPVGAKFEYSNSNYNILGLVVEAASGESYSAYIQKQIFEPLEMMRSFSSKAAAQQNGLAVGHRYWFGIPVAAPDLQIPGGSLPSGQLISSATDLAHYLIAQLNAGRYREKQLLSGPGIAELHRPVAAILEMGQSIGHYAMGWISQGNGNSRIVWHSGIVPDFGAFMALLPEPKKGLVLLFNANHAMLKMAFDEFGMGAAQRLAGLPASPTPWANAIWLQRALALIPILQLLDVVVTLRNLRRWRQNPRNLPSPGRLWRQHLLLPLLPNLLAALTLIPMGGRLRGFTQLFMPDVAWIARPWASFGLGWSLLRTKLILRAGKTRRP